MRGANYIFGLLCIIVASCVSVPKGFEGIPPGEWRGYFKVYPQDNGAENAAIKKTTDADYTKIPFNFEVTNTEDSLYITFVNGDERIKVDHVKMGIDRKTSKDTIEIHFDEYDTYMKGVIEEGIMEGYWFVNYKQNYAIPFIAYHGQNHRFVNHSPKQFDNFNGLWDVTFDYDKGDDAYKAVGSFAQDGNKIKGTFMTETGDYRYLFGDVDGNKMKLSTFDGSHAFYFEAKQVKDGELVGIFKSGKHYTSNWSATKNANASLTDPYALTEVVTKPDWNSMQFTDLKGDDVTLVDSDHKQQIAIINIMGTWCPNCKDETVFLQDYLAKNPNLPINVKSVAYERYDDQAKNIEILKRYKDKMNINWDVYLGGKLSKTEAKADFPFLSKIMSYPTMIIVDKQHNVRKVHTGFNGPATPKYASYANEFDNLIKQLASE